MPRSFPAAQPASLPPPSWLEAWTQWHPGGLPDHTEFSKFAAFNGQLYKPSAWARSLGITVHQLQQLLSDGQHQGIWQLWPAWRSPEETRKTLPQRLYFQNPAHALHAWGIHQHSALESSPLAPLAWQHFVAMQARLLLPHLDWYHYRSAYGARLDAVGVQQGAVQLALAGVWEHLPPFGRGYTNARRHLGKPPVILVTPNGPVYAQGVGRLTTSIEFLPSVLGELGLHG